MNYKIKYINSIDSINVYTIYDFDEEHPAGSSVNNILLYLNYMGETEEVNINELSSVTHHFKFSAVPSNDSLQFTITGRITDEMNFALNTNLIVVD